MYRQWLWLPPKLGFIKRWAFIESTVRIVDNPFGIPLHDMDMSMITKTKHYKVDKSLSDGELQIISEVIKKTYFRPCQSKKSDRFLMWCRYKK